MSDDKLELPETPSWLQPGAAPSPPAEKQPGDWANAGDPVADIAAAEPQPEIPPIEPDPPPAADTREADPRIAFICDALLHFKRVWHLPAGTSDEKQAAIAFATLVVEAVDLVKQQPEEPTNGSEPQRRRTRSKPS